MIVIAIGKRIFPKEYCNAYCFDELNQETSTKDDDPFFLPKVIQRVFWKAFLYYMNKKFVQYYMDASDWWKKSSLKFARFFMHCMIGVFLATLQIMISSCFILFLRLSISSYEKIVLTFVFDFINISMILTASW